MLVWLVLLLASLLVLVAASKRLTTAAETIAALLGVPTFVVGATVVAVGTSLPELAISVVAALRGAADIPLANVVGSNIFNATIVVGIAAFSVRRLVLDGTARLLLLPVATAALLIAMSDGSVSAREGIALTLFGLFSIALFAWGGRRGGRSVRLQRPRGSLIIEIAILLFMVIFLHLAAAAAVQSVIGLSAVWHVAPAIVSLVVLAAGTSLPELAITLTAVRRGAAGIALGNILGSNIINMTLVAGLPALITPLVAGSKTLDVGLTMLVASTIMLIVLTLLRRVARSDAVALFGAYALFLFLILFS